MSKKEILLQDPDIRRWYNNVARGSKVTAEVALRRLSFFCELNNTNPKQLIKLPRKKIQDMIEDTVTKLESENKAPDYIQGIVKGVKSWLRHNEIELKRKIKVKDSGTAVTLAKERVPKPSEIDQILAAGDLRAKVSIALICYGGLRLQSLGNYSGTDGLRLGDFPDLELNSNPHFTEIPARVIVRRELSKARHQYFTYLNEKGCSFVIDYLKERIGRGEKLTKESPLIKATERKQGSGFVTTANIGDEIRRAIRRAGFNWRPYVLRAYFDTQMLIAENNGAISKDFRVFFMGHVGDIERRYTIGKGILPEDLLREMRNGYQRASEFLIQSKAEITAKEVAKETELNVVSKLGRLFGIDVKQIEKNLAEELGRSPNVDEILNEVYETIETYKLVREAKEAAEANKNDPKKIVSEDELEQYLDDGWDVQTVLPSGKILIRRQA